MATHKSAEKRARQEIRRSARNAGVRNAVRTFEKKVRTAIASNDKKSAATLLQGYMSEMDSACSKNVFHRATAARKISRLSTTVSKMK